MMMMILIKSSLPKEMDQSVESEVIQEGSLIMNRWLINQMIMRNVDHPRIEVPMCCLICPGYTRHGVGSSHFRNHGCGRHHFCFLLEPTMGTA